MCFACGDLSHELDVEKREEILYDNEIIVDMGVI